MRLLADLHTHTVASGHAYSTLTENVHVARSRGMELVAVTDHGPRVPQGAQVHPDAPGRPGPVRGLGRSLRLGHGG